MQLSTIIDGDGHVLQDPQAISGFLPSPYRELGPFAMSKLLPPLDHLHSQPFELLPDAFGAGKPVGDCRNGAPFMEYTRIQQAVLYPTWALAYGRMVNPDWAIAVCRAYNDWLHATYTLVRTGAFRAWRSSRCRNPARRSPSYGVLSRNWVSKEPCSRPMASRDTWVRPNTGRCTKRPRRWVALSPHTVGRTVAWASIT